MTVFCGGGNNAGDGYVIARLALDAGWSVRLSALQAVDQLSGAAHNAAVAFQTQGGVVEAFADDSQLHADVVVDALLGTGVDRNVEGVFSAAIDTINTYRQAGCRVVAVDVPSGLDAGTGAIHGTVVHADLSPTFIGLKLGLLTAQGPATAGIIAFDDLRAPPEIGAGVQPLASRISAADLKTHLTPRSRTAHKNHGGHLLCVGGNRGMGGAIRLTAEAGLRTGSGLVSVACHPDHAAVMSQARPELMALGVDDPSAEQTLIDRADVVVLGPGLGTDGWAEERYQAAIQSERPLLIDADALNRLSHDPIARGRWILTPHPGEAARLLDCTKQAIERDRPTAVRMLAERYNCVAILKGAGTLVACGDQIAVNTTGNPGMAVGGMGDLLAGVIASLWGQGLSAFDAARAGVRIHGAAADAAAADAGERGLLPSDLFAYIRATVNPSDS